MEKKESILSDRAKKVVEYFSRKPVGGQIHEKNFYLWENYKQRCVDYKIKMSPEGMEHMLRLSSKIDAVLFPIAKAAGIGIIQFTEDRIDKLLKAVADNNDWIDTTETLHKNIIKETDSNIVINAKNV